MSKLLSCITGMVGASMSSGFNPSMWVDNNIQDEKKLTYGAKERRKKRKAQRKARKINRKK